MPVGSVNPDPLAEDARDFRAAKFVNGLEYREVGLGEKFREARRAFRSTVRGSLAPRPARGVPLPPARTMEPTPFVPPVYARETGTLVPFDISTRQALILGADQRTFAVSGTVAIATETARAAQVHIDGCSATLIGTHTAITAAHCIYQRGRAAQDGQPAIAAGWKTGVLDGAWSVGRTSRAPYSSPSSFTVSNVWGPVYGCMDAVVPLNYMTNQSDSEAFLDDFGILDFVCGYLPGAGGNFYSPAYGPDGDYASATPSALHAYDGIGADAVLPAGAPVPQTVWGWNYEQPSLVKRYSNSSAVTIANTYHVHGNHLFDATGGSSGGGLVSRLFASVGDGTFYWTASVVGSSNVEHITTGTASARLAFRRLTAGSWGFIVANASEY